MKTIRIFVASSINELKQERNELGRFVTGINNRILDRGVYCRLELCENEDQAMPRSDRKQDEYNALIKDAHAVFVLFFKKAGCYTIEELKFAHDCFRESGAPKVYTYFKDFDEAALTDEVRAAYELITAEYQHFFSTFENVATIEVDILRVLFDLTLEPSLKITEEDGRILLGDTPIMSADELDYIRNNAEITRLKAKIVGLREGDKRYTEGLFGEEIDDEIDRCEKRLKARYNDCFKALEKRYRNVTESSPYDPELQAAYNASANGDYETVLRLLSREKLEMETRQRLKEERISHKLYLETTFNKYLQRINALKSTDDHTALEETYADTIRAIDAFHLFEIDPSCLDVWYEYASYLYDQNHSVNALEVSGGLERIYLYKPDVATDSDRAALWNLMGILYDNHNNSKKADEYYRKAIRIYEELAAKNPERFNPDLATSYNNAGTFYRDQGAPEKAEEFFLKAIRIREELTAENPEHFNPDLADSYNNAGAFYSEQGTPEKAEEFYLKAIRIYEDLAAKNPERFNPDLAGSYNNAGIFYSEQGAPEKAAEFYRKAIRIYEEFAARNPERFNPNLAGSYNNAGVFYSDQGAPEKAEEFYRKAIRIREELATGNPERFNPNLAESYSNAGNFYSNQGAPKKAERFYLKAIRIYEELAARNPERFNPDLAKSYNNAGYFYSNQGAPEKAEKFYRKAIRIREELTAKNPERFNPNLADSYNNAGAFYSDQGAPEKAEEFFLKAIRIREDLAAKNPERFNPDLAGSYNNAGYFYSNKGAPEKTEEFFLKAIRIYEDLAAKNPTRYNADLAVPYYGYAIFKKDVIYLRKAYRLAQTALHDPRCRIIVAQLSKYFDK